MSKLTPNQQAWVDALRSGEYAQTADALACDDGFCCLGVACIVAEKHGVDVLKMDGMLFGNTLAEQPKVRAWLNLASVDGTSSPGTPSLIELNDERGKSFSEIADVIEANADKLFVQEGELNLGEGFSG